MTDPESTRIRGRRAEDVAAAHLQAHGLVIVARNVTLAGAEIDLIARWVDSNDSPTIVFVEVRSRAHPDLGHPLETIGPQKQRRITRAATAWLVREGLWERVAVRFDAIAIVGDEISWVPDAFHS
jgi:putative endonuclease